MQRNRIRKRRNNRTKYNKHYKTILIIVILFLVMLFFSVIFSIINMVNKKIVNGVKIGDVDVSNLTNEQAKEKIEKWYKDVILSNITVEFQNFEDTIDMNQIVSENDIEKKVKEANLVGKTGNIIKDNFEILSTMMFSKQIEINIELSEDEINKKIEEINDKLPSAMKESNYYIEEDKLIIVKGKEGVQVEENQFKNELEKTLYKQENRKFIIPTKEVQPKEIDLEKIHNEIYVEAENAVISEDLSNVKSEINGVDFAISLEEANNIINEDKDEYEIPLKITIPDITLEKEGAKAFKNKLSEYKTSYNTTNENRETNLKLASEKVNGTIILPGEIFSYNKIVGQRTIANGYKEATVYSEGKVVNGIGGGICQLSSTLYNAAIYADLEITQRINHRFLTSYVTAGRDATVSWGTIDFCFKNTRKYPIKIVSTVKNGVVTTAIYGTKEENEYDISIESNIIETIPYSVNYVKDDSLNQEEEQIVQYGANGAKCETYKVVKNNDEVISRTLLSNDTYSPLEKIVKKGTNQGQEEATQVVEETDSQLNDLNPELLDAIKELD